MKKHPLKISRCFILDMDFGFIQHFFRFPKQDGHIVSLRHDNSNDFNITFAYTVERFVFLVVYRIESGK